LDLGVTPLANSYLTAEQLDRPEAVAELALQLCTRCGLSQLTRVVDRDRMFRDYLYVSSTSDTFRTHCAELAATAMRFVDAKADEWALDIASNDGLLLSRFEALGMRVFGVDPALNLAAEAAARGIPTIPEYWTSDLARDAVKRFGRPRTITATNVLAHVDDVHEFVTGVKLALMPRGVFVVEVPYVLDFVQKNEFDTAYHEHLSYYGVHPVQQLLGAHDLDLVRVELFPDIHGGTIRFFACHRGEREPDVTVAEALDRERDFGVLSLPVYREFGDRVRENMAKLADLVRGLHAEGGRVWAYGASAKGNTLMNFAHLTNDAVPVVVDDNPKKWSLFTPGAHMRVTGPAELGTAKPEYLLLLAWNFETEIVRRSRAAGHNGKFIRPVPEARVFG